MKKTQVAQLEQANADLLTDLERGRGERELLRQEAHREQAELVGNIWRLTEQLKAVAAERSASRRHEERLAVQARREVESGVAYPQDTTWQQEFEGSFIYTETEDQLRALDEIKADITRRRPMDRLLCGDVGYGKTELAMRAAFKVIEYGKQVAVLVPTTVLAEQHYRTFRERMADYKRPRIVELVDELCMDSISCGVSVAYAMEYNKRHPDAPVAGGVGYGGHSFLDPKHDKPTQVAHLRVRQSFDDHLSPDSRGIAHRQADQRLDWRGGRRYVGAEQIRRHAKPACCRVFRVMPPSEPIADIRCTIVRVITSVSMLTRSPVVSFDNVVRSSVVGMSATEKACLRKSAIVSETPSTATEPLGIK